MADLDNNMEGKMTKADLYKLASYAKKLFEQIQDSENLEPWVQTKVTKAADNIASVYHYLEYETKFNDYGKFLSESSMDSEQKARALSMLSEAKAKMKELKKSQAAKIAQESKEHDSKDSFDASDKEGDTYKTKTGHKATKTKTGARYEKQFPDSYKGHGNSPDKDLDEDMSEPCPHCGGHGHVAKAHPRDRAHPTVVAKAEAYHTKMKATAAAIKRMNKSSEDELIPEGSMPMKKVNGKSVPAFAADGKGKNDLTKKKLKENMSPAELAHHHASEYAKHHKAGNIELMKHHKDECMKHGGKLQHGAMGECYHSHPAIKGGQMYECGTETPAPAMAPVATPAPAMAPGIAEGKPSAGLSKEKKSAVVKKAKAGGDIGKPGKSFDKVAKAAGGGKKGEKIAAAAMWKNIKETTAYVAEKAEVEKKAKKDYDGDGEVESGKDEYLGSRIAAAKKAGKLKECGPDCTCAKCKPVNESADFVRMKEQMARLNRAETTQINESSEADKIRALTKLLG
jgi:hypothetical protein